jgi:hypothetical protein
MSFIIVPVVLYCYVMKLDWLEVNRCLEQVTDDPEQKILNIMIPNSSAIFGAGL